MRIRTTMAVAATTLLVALGTPFAVAQDSDDVSDTTTITETDTVIEEVAEEAEDPVAEQRDDESAARTPEPAAPEAPERSAGARAANADDEPTAALQAEEVTPEIVVVENPYFRVLDSNTCQSIGGSEYDIAMQQRSDDGTWTGDPNGPFAIDASSNTLRQQLLYYPN